MPFDPSKVPILLNLHNRLGHSTQVQIQAHELTSALIHYGASGWQCGSNPGGGIDLPLGLFPVFNFALIAADASIIRQNDEQFMVLRQHGNTYYHHFGAADQKAGRPAAVWFSRKAQPGDPAAIILTGRQKRKGKSEEETPEPYEYVPLIAFRGPGRITSEMRGWCIEGSVDRKGEIIKPHWRLPGSDQQKLQQSLEEIQDNWRLFSSAPESAGQPDSRPPASVPSTPW